MKNHDCPCREGTLHIKVNLIKVIVSSFFGQYRLSEYSNEDEGKSMNNINNVNKDGYCYNQEQRKRKYHFSYCSDIEVLYQLYCYVRF